MFWPGMVLNQGQLSIVVSDWEPYFDSPFPPFCVWEVVFVCWHYSLKLHVVFVLFIVFVGVIIQNKKAYVRSQRCTLVQLFRQL